MYYSKEELIEFIGEKGMFYGRPEDMECLAEAFQIIPLKTLKEVRKNCTYICAPRTGLFTTRNVIDGRDVIVFDFTGIDRIDRILSTLKLTAMGLYQQTPAFVKFMEKNPESYEGQDGRQFITQPGEDIIEQAVKETCLDWIIDYLDVEDPPDTEFQDFILSILNEFKG